MLNDELPIEEVLPDFKKFIEGSILVAHNAHLIPILFMQNLKK